MSSLPFDKPQCIICIDDLSDDRVELVCSHSYCRECLVGWYTSQIEEGNITMKCPSSECNETVEDWVLESILPQEILEKLQYFQLHKTLNKEFNMFYCPKSDCKEIVAAPDGAIRVRCIGCKTEFCIKCRVEWHTGSSCEKYQEFAVENKNADALTIKFLRDGKAKQCPKCWVWIEKNEGCDHMTCKNCKYEFWWTNLKPFRLQDGKFEPSSPILGRGNQAPRALSERILVARELPEALKKKPLPFLRIIESFKALDVHDQILMLKELTLIKDTYVPPEPYDRELLETFPCTTLKTICKSMQIPQGTKDHMIANIMRYILRDV